MSFRLTPAKNTTKIRAFTFIIMISILFSFFGILLTLISLDAENILFVEQDFEGFNELKRSLGKLQELRIQDNLGADIEKLRVSWISVGNQEWQVTFYFLRNNSKFTNENFNRLFTAQITTFPRIVLSFDKGEIFGPNVENWFITGLYGDTYSDEQPYPTQFVFYQLYESIRFRSAPNIEITDPFPVFYVGSLNVLFPQSPETTVGLYWVTTGNLENVKDFQLISPLTTRRLVTLDELPDQIGKSVAIVAPIAAIVAAAVMLILILPPILFVLILNFLDSRLKFMRRPPIWWIRRMEGRLGKFFSLLRLGKFDGDYMIEEHLVKDYSADKAHQLVKHVMSRWKQIFLIPASIAALLLSILLEITTIPSPDQWGVVEIIFVPFIVWFLPTIFVVLFFPAVWLLQDAGVKRIKFADTGDLEEVSYLGSEISSSFEQFFGIPAILVLANKLFSVSSLSFIPTFGSRSELLDVLNQLTLGTIQINFQLPFRFIAAFGLLMFLGGIFLPAGAILIFHLTSPDLIRSIRRTRAELLQKGIATAGAIFPQLKPGTEDFAVFEDLSELKEEMGQPSGLRTLLWVSISLISILLTFLLIFILIRVLQSLFI